MKPIFDLKNGFLERSPNGDVEIWMRQRYTPGSTGSIADDDLVGTIKKGDLENVAAWIRGEAVSELV